MKQQLAKQIEFIVEIDKLKNIERRTKLIHGSRMENDAEHSWHLAMMAIILHSHANEDVDLLKVIKMLLIHDIVEIDAGDTFAYDTAGHDDKFEREMQAARRIYGILPDDQARELMDLWLEFEQQETPEAKFALALDRLQPIIHNYRNQGDTWKKHQITGKQVRKRNEVIQSGSSSLWEYAQRIMKHAEEAGYLPEK
jgi:putative hydrolase of HD superfamily